VQRSFKLVRLPEAEEGYALAVTVSDVERLFT